MKTEPLKILHYKHMPWSFSQTPYRIHFVIKGNAELDGKKCKKLVRELEIKLKNFSHKFDDRICCSCSELSGFFYYRASQTQINGGFHSFGIHASFGSSNENSRRKDSSRVTALLNKLLKTWRFAYYTTSLKITSVDPK